MSDEDSLSKEYLEALQAVEVIVKSGRDTGIPLATIVQLKRSAAIDMVAGDISGGGVMRELAHLYAFLRGEEPEMALQMLIAVLHLASVRLLVSAPGKTGFDDASLNAVAGTLEATITSYGYNVEALGRVGAANALDAQICDENTKIETVAGMAIAAFDRLGQLEIARRGSQQ